jgi:hypothetical protein
MDFMGLVDILAASRLARQQFDSLKAAMNRRTSRRPSSAILTGQDEKPCGVGRDARAPLLSEQYWG